MKKLLIGVAIVIGLVLLARPAFEWVLLNEPSAIGWISRVVDPIGETQEVVWQSGPEAADVPPSERPPNVVVILVDDLGWNDLTWRGGGVAGGTVPTPNIDSLARDGAEFTMGYAGNATCAPSRAALMTGRYPGRFGFESTPRAAQHGQVRDDLC